MKPLRRLAALVALVLVLPAFAAESPKLAGVGSAMVVSIAANEIAGAVTLVTTKDKIIHLETTGFADIAMKKPMTPDTLFWIASMTKPMTAVCIAMLVDEGKLSVDDPVEKRLPEFGTQWQISEQTPERRVLVKPARPITIRDLFKNVQRNYFRIYFHYTYFNVFRYTFLQASTFFPYIALGPSIVTGAITFGIFQQILNAFGEVSSSFRFLMNSWTTIINLISIYQRLRGFERQIPAEGRIFANDYDDPRYLATETVPAAATRVVVPE